MTRNQPQDAHHEYILSRTFTGARWMLYLSASALLAGFFTNVILARAGVETLGFYSLLMLIVSMVQTFFVFGAANVLIQFIPNLDLNDRPRFIFTYSILVFLFGGLLLVLCLLFPSILQVVFRQELEISINLYLVTLVPILLAQALAWAILQAELEGTILAISQNAVSWFYFVNIGALLVLGFFGARDLMMEIVFWAVVLANVIALCIGIYFLRRDYFRLDKSRGFWFLPKGFWRFGLTLHTGTLFNFMISNAAPVFILRELSIRDLGYFRAAMVFAGFVSWIPSVFDKAFYPSFTNLISKNLPTDDVYGKFSRINALSSGLVALVILLFTRELLTVFGKEFTEGSFLLLALLSAGYVVSSPFLQVNFALVTAKLKTPHTMVAYALGAVAAVFFYSILVHKYGLTGIGIAFIALQIILLILSWLLTWYFTRVPFPVRAFSITLIVVGVGMIGALGLPEVTVANTLMKAGLFVSCIASFLFFRLVTRDEVMEMLTLMIPGSIMKRFST